MVVTCFSAVGQPFGNVGQTMSYQQVAVHHHRCGRSGACVSRFSGCCEPVQCALRSPHRALRQVHRLLRFVRRVLERVSYLRERVTRVGEGLRPDRGSMIVGLFRLLRTTTRPYAALNPGFSAFVSRPTTPNQLRAGDKCHPCPRSACYPCTRSVPRAIRGACVCGATESRQTAKDNDARPEQKHSCRSDNNGLRIGHAATKA